MSLEEKMISGVYCPRCNSEYSRVRDSRLIDGYRCRNKECEKCGSRWTTKEILCKCDYEIEKRKCIYCEKMYVAKKKAQKTCGSEECKKRLNKENGEKWAIKKKKMQELEKPKKILTITQISKMAKEEGLSYGEYVQMYNV